MSNFWYRSKLTNSSSSFLFFMKSYFNTRTILIYIHHGYTWLMQNDCNSLLALLSLLFFCVSILHRILFLHKSLQPHASVSQIQNATIYMLTRTSLLYIYRRFTQLHSEVSDTYRLCLIQDSCTFYYRVSTCTRLEYARFFDNDESMNWPRRMVLI